MSSTEVLSVIEQWLSDNASKIQSFWVGAEWRLWARFELFYLLENKFNKTHLVNHSISLWEHKHEQEVDVLLEPRGSDAKPLAIRIRCERVDENAGSFEKFSKQFRDDWNFIIESIENIDGSFEGVEVMLLGLSGEKVEIDEDEPAFGALKPEGFHVGEVYAWSLTTAT